MLINEVENTVILFQGNHIDFIKKYLLEQGIDKDNIYIKG
jgi:translation initiation factor 1 (eIF-1/SUI1)